MCEETSASVKNPIRKHIPRKVDLLNKYERLSECLRTKYVPSSGWCILMFQQGVERNVDISSPSKLQLHGLEAPERERAGGGLPGRLPRVDGRPDVGGHAALGQLRRRPPRAQGTRTRHGRRVGSQSKRVTHSLAGRQQ